jgi:hypothetical protein
MKKLSPHIISSNILMDTHPWILALILDYLHGKNSLEIDQEQNQQVWDFLSYSSGNITSTQEALEHAFQLDCTEGTQVLGGTTHQKYYLEVIHEIPYPLAKIIAIWVWA